MTSAKQSALNYINKYKSEATIIDDLLKEPPLPDNMPILWSDIVFADQSSRVSHTINAWKEHFSYEFESLISVFDTHLKDVFLIKYDQTYSLVYEIGDGKTSHYYEGRNPLAKKINASAAPLWPKLPAGLRKFYDSLHDGWCYLASDSMGLVPAKDFLVLDDQEWGILDDIDVDLDLTKVVGIFSNGMGDYVCLNTEQEPVKALLWYHDEEPDLTIDFWPTVDEWTVIGIREDINPET